MSNHHEMRKLTTHDSGAEEWICDECGRHLKFQLEPFNRTVLFDGDERVSHSGNSFGTTFSVNIGTATSDEGRESSVPDGTVLH